MGIFVQSETGAPHEHAGSVHATDAEMALQNARDVYARRGTAISLWVVPSKYVTATTPGDTHPFFDPAATKSTVILDSSKYRKRSKDFDGYRFPDTKIADVLVLRLGDDRLVLGHRLRMVRPRAGARRRYRADEYCS